MYGYAGASAAATAFAPYQAPPNTTTPEGLFNQAVATAESLAQPAGSSGQNAAAASSQLTQAATIPNLLQQLANNSPFINGLQQFLGAIPNGTNPFSVDIPANWATPILKQTLQAYFGVGLANFGWSIGQQLTFGQGTTIGAAGGWFPTPQFAGLHLGGAYGVNAVSGGGGGNGALLASAGQAGKVGVLSVPANWTTPTSEATTTLAAMEETPANAGAAGGPNALLRGMPMGGVGRRTAGYGYTNKYGFRYSVLTRPPSAG
jgi:PPE-repeat protein